MPGSSVRGSLPSVRFTTEIPTPSREPLGECEEREKGKRTKTKGLGSVLDETEADEVKPVVGEVPEPP